MIYLVAGIMCFDLGRGGEICTREELWEFRGSEKECHEVAIPALRAWLAEKGIRLVEPKCQMEFET